MTRNQGKKCQQKQTYQTLEVAGKDFKITIINMIQTLKEKLQKESNENSRIK